MIDWIIDLARRAERRIMVRLVKGAYWDAEIKRAQVDGLTGLPGLHPQGGTPTSPMSPAPNGSWLRATVVFPQFAHTHNAQTLAAIYHLAGRDAAPDAYEFQCLHGMGEPPLRRGVWAARSSDARRAFTRPSARTRRCSPTWCAGFSRRRQPPFVNRISDPKVSVEALIADPTELVAASRWSAPRPARGDRRPADLFAPERVNSRGLDLSDETVLARLWRTSPRPRRAGLCRRIRFSRGR